MLGPTREKYAYKLTSDAQNNQKEKMSTERKGEPFKSHMLCQKYFNFRPLGETLPITGPTQFNKAHSLLGRKSIITRFHCFFFLKK